MIKIYIIIFFLILFIILDYYNTKSKILELHKEAYLVYNKEKDKELRPKECGPCRRCPPSAPRKVCPKIDMNLYMSVDEKTICPEIIMSSWIDKENYKKIIIITKTLKKHIDNFKKNISNIFESEKKYISREKTQNLTSKYWNLEANFFENLHNIVIKEYSNANIELKKINEIVSNNRNKICFLNKNQYENIIKELLTEIDSAKNILRNIEKIKIKAFNNSIELKNKEEKQRIAAELAKIKAEKEAEIKRKKAEEAARLAKIREEKAEEAARLAKIRAEEAARLAKIRAEKEKAEEAARLAKIRAEKEKAEEAARLAKIKAEKAEEAARLAKIRAEKEKAEEAARLAKLPNPNCRINTPCTYKGETHTCYARWKWLTNKRGESPEEAAAKIKGECKSKCDCTAANYKEEKKQFVKGDWFWPANNNSVPHFYKRGIGLYAQRFGGWGGNDPMYNSKWRQWIIDSSDNKTLFLMTKWAPRFKSHTLTTWSPPLDFLVPYRGNGASFYGQKDASNNEGQYFVSGNIYIPNRWCHTYWVSAKGYIFQLSNKSINNFRWGMGFSLSATVSRVYCNKSGVRGESNLTKYLKKAIFRFTGYNSRGDMFNKTNGTLLLEIHGTSWMKGWNTFTTSGKYSHIDYEKISNDNISGEVNIPIIIYGQ